MLTKQAYTRVSFQACTLCVLHMIVYRVITLRRIILFLRFSKQLVILHHVIIIIIIIISDRQYIYWEAENKILNNVWINYIQDFFD
jgi:hypothetical protein